ncbi:CDP-alcohol phosphatidyltransferase family protein [uncultured Flavobacterium sp.]|uniref:CDP-alcohol phosphatidyltransferase family protein n=1 Tax=uncultured Flavobacterium sp. TaxID=165435 RepID=UPI0030EB495D|tara:strand:- start:290520 stop:291266 length:747 start_codon:yes stop_codon:yes gene_type:complete
MEIKKHVPNFITLLNLASGLLAIIAVFKGYYDEAFLFVCLGIFFDFWDGFLARKLGVSGELGLQLDSLADMVTSGVVPGLIMFKLIETIQNTQSQYNVTEETFYMGMVPYFGFLITIASAYRLAKFNIDKRQIDSFIGLPTPANALFIMSIPMIQYVDNYEWITNLLNNPFVLMFLTILSAYFLNANIPLFSLKLKSFDWKSAKLQYSFMAFAVVLFLMFDFIAIPIIVISYVLLSVLFNLKSKPTIG